MTSKWTGKWIVALEQQDWEHATYMAFDDVAGLIELAQIGNLELHPWSSRPNREMEELAKCPAHWLFYDCAEVDLFPVRWVSPQRRREFRSKIHRYPESVRVEIHIRGNSFNSKYTTILKALDPFSQSYTHHKT